MPISKRRTGKRSGLEERVADQFAEAGVAAQYEPFAITYTPPVKSRRYTPDFITPSGCWIEVKGRLTVRERSKYLAIKREYPNQDLRFVFSNSRQRLRKGGPRTVRDWCRQWGFKCADGAIPLDWLHELAEPSHGCSASGT